MDSTPAAGGRISTVGIVAATHRPEAVEWARVFAERLSEMGAQLRLIEQLGENNEFRHCCGDQAYVAASDLIIVLGGDGTLLSVARCAGPIGTPILGLDVGSFGFLAKGEPGAAIGELDRLLAGEFAIEPRMMLRLSIEDADGTRTAEDCALNDAVVSGADGRHVVCLRTEVDGEQFGTYRADGLIVATPTGSTGYNLSAGGPIVDPRMSCMVLTAVCPHTLCYRPMVLPDHVQVRVCVPEGGKHPGVVTATVDGQKSYVLERNSSAVIEMAPHVARLVRLHDRPYFPYIVSKLMPGLAE